MTTTKTTARTEGHVRVGDADLWYVQQGDGPDVLLIAGLSDPAEAWDPQLEGLSDRYRLTAFDNRGAGRSPMPAEGFTVEQMAEDAAGLLQALHIGPAHVAGFSGGSVTAQHLALRHPELVRSLVLQSTWAKWDPHTAAVFAFLRWLVDVAPDERSLWESFLLWIYTPRAHADGSVAQIVEEALAFPHPQSAGAFQRQLDAWAGHDSREWLHRIAVPTLVLAGGADLLIRPELGREVADQIPGAHFSVLAGEAHQPFQEVPETWNTMVHDFWSNV